MKSKAFGAPKVHTLYYNKSHLVLADKKSGLLTPVSKLTFLEIFILLQKSVERWSGDKGRHRHLSN